MDKGAWVDRESNFLQTLQLIGLDTPNTSTIELISDEFANLRHYVMPGGLTRIVICGLCRLLGLSSWPRQLMDYSIADQTPTEAGVYRCQLDNTYQPTTKLTPLITVGKGEPFMSAEEVLYVVIRLKHDEGITPPLGKGWTIKTRNTFPDLTVRDNLLIGNYGNCLNDPTRSSGIKLWGVGDSLISPMPRCHCLPRLYRPLTRRVDWSIDRGGHWRA